MGWNILFYQKENGEIPVKDFITMQAPKMQAKIAWEIDLLSERGLSLAMPHARPLSGTDGLLELRIQAEGNISRIFYVTYVNQTFVLLHGFAKKTEQIPKHELEKAINNYADFKRRFQHERAKGMERNQR